MNWYPVCVGPERVGPPGPLQGDGHRGQSCLCCWASLLLCTDIICLIKTFLALCTFLEDLKVCFLSACVGNPGIAQTWPFNALIPFSLDCFVDSSALFCSTYTENKGQLSQQISVKALEKNCRIYIFFE